MLSRQAYWGLVSNKRYSLELRYIPCIAICNAVWTTLIWFCMFHTCPGLFSHPWICEHLISHKLLQSSRQVSVKCEISSTNLDCFHTYTRHQLLAPVGKCELAQRCIDYLNFLLINGLFQSDGYTSWKNQKVQKIKFSRNKKFENQKFQKCSRIKKFKNIEKFQNP